MPLPSAPFNPADSIVNGLSVIQFKQTGSLITPATVATTTGLFTKTAHGLKVNQQVILTAITSGTGFVAGNYYWVVSAPSADTFTLSATRGGSNVIPSVAGTAASLQPVWVFEVSEATDKGSVEEKNIMRPNFKGQTFKARSWAGKIEESWEISADDVKRVFAMLGGTRRGRLVGTAIVWQPDIDDTTTCAQVSEADWPCTLMVDGDTKAGGGEAMKITVKFISNKAGLLTYTTDAAV